MYAPARKRQLNTQSTTQNKLSPSQNASALPAQLTEQRHLPHTHTNLRSMRDNSQRAHQLKNYQQIANRYTEVIQRSVLNFKSRPNVPVVQLDKGKQARDSEVVDILKKGREKMGASLGTLRPYLGSNKENFIFLVGLIGGGFNFSSLNNFINIINSKEGAKKNAILQTDITYAFDKVIQFKDEFTAIVGEKRAQFRSGRIAEFQGLAGELSAAAQLIKTGHKVNRLGAIMGYGSSKSQEVDLVTSHEDQLYFVEVAATPSKLRDKIDGGIDGSYPQMQGYKKLSRESKNSRVAYSCPTLSIEQISSQFIDKISQANVDLIVKGTIYDAAGLRNLVEQNNRNKADSKIKKTKSHKQTKRDDRRARLRDRGSVSSAKSLLDHAMRDYHDESAPSKKELAFDKAEYSRGYEDGYSIGLDDGEYDKNNADLEIDSFGYSLPALLNDKYDDGMYDGYADGYKAGFDGGQSA